MDQKQKQLLIAVGAVCGIIVLALAYFLFSAVGENADLKKKRDKDMSALLAGNRADPYPSEANRQVREDDAKNAEAQIAEVKEVLAKGNAVLARSVGQPPSESSFQDYVRNTSESSFQTFISRSVSELNQRQGTPLAQRLRGQTAQNQQEEQAYSFERYVHQGTPPTKPDIPRLPSPPFFPPQRARGRGHVHLSLAGYSGRRGSEWRGEDEGREAGRRC